MKSTRVLIVDDEPDILELLSLTLTRMKLATITARDLESAKRHLTENECNFCITDMNLPDGSGLQLIRHIQMKHPTIPVAVLTAYGSMETAIEALKAGAFDFVSKPVELNKLREIVTHALKLSTQPMLVADNTLKSSPILGTSETIKKLRSQIEKLARSQAPIYICGESGVGKELVARQLHAKGSRADGPFIPVNCGAIPTDLMESEFFGHKKGSFTGALEDKAGLFQTANGGTLFLDEIAELPMHMQVKLLRALQEKAIKPIGASREVPVDVRILTATHKDLEELVDHGQFRRDLLYRINVIQIEVLPLRDRPDDIPILAAAFLDALEARWNAPVPRLGQAAQKALMQYNYPGNVRELENILERAATLCDTAEITPENLQIKLEIKPNKSRGEPGDMFDMESESLEDYLIDIEKSAILKALEDTRWNRTAAAKRLGMSFRSLRYRLKKLGLDTDDVQE